MTGARDLLVDEALAVDVDSVPPAPEAASNTRDKPAA